MQTQLQVTKKMLVSGLVFLLASISNYSFAKTNEPLKTGDPAGTVTTLIIDANVTVVLVNSDKAVLNIAGDNSLTKFITFTRSGDSLTIGSTKKRNSPKRATVYVPASQLRNIRVNGNAEVRSLFALRVPKLNVLINGDCSFAISNVGEINISSTELYSIEKTTEERALPSVIYWNN